MIVKETIEFKRKGDPKKSLKLGIRELTEDPEILAELLEKDFDEIKVDPTVYIHKMPYAKHGQRSISKYKIFQIIWRPKNPKLKEKSKFEERKIIDWIRKNTNFEIYHFTIASSTERGLPPHNILIERKWWLYLYKPEENWA